MTETAADQPKFILVVEDDPVLRNLLGHTFSGKYQTLYASNGEEALAYVEQYKPALILLDIMLPGMNGFDILGKIRERPDALKNTPIVIVSNLGQASDKERARILGATGYLVKAEVSIEEIVSKIEQVLGASATGGTAETLASPVRL
jgi:CheY-like chemotaxis protein